MQDFNFFEISHVIKRLTLDQLYGILDKKSFCRRTLIAWLHCFPASKAAVEAKAFFACDLVGFLCPRH